MIPDNPRRTRQTFNEPGDAHELTFSVFRRERRLLESGVAEAFLRSLARASEEQSFEIWAYVVMPEHCHVLLYPERETYSISEILKSIKSPSAKAIFDLHPSWRETMMASRPSRGVEARFWQQGGGYDRNLDRAKSIRASVEYIHENPVRRGLVEEATDWAWSSARDYAGLPGEISVSLCPLRV